MKESMFVACNNLDEVQKATSNLDKSKLCSLKIDDGGVIKDVDNFKGVYNITQGKFCASVVPYYNLVQHKEYFDSFAEAMTRLNINFKMIIKQSGNKSFADIDFQDKNIKFDKLNEEFVTGIRLINSYNKSTGLIVAPRFTRLACANGMIITRTMKTVSIKHNSKILKELQSFIEKKLNSIINESTHLQTWVSEGMADSVEWRVAARILEKLFTQIKHREEILKRLEISLVVVTDKKTKKKNVSYVLDNKEKKKVTRWDLYNACTHYISHGEHITPHIEDVLHKKAERLLDTPLAKMPKIKVTV